MKSYAPLASCRDATRLTPRPTTSSPGCGVPGDIRRLVIVTKEEQETIAVGGTSIEVTPAWRFLLQLAEPGALATDMP